MTRSAAVIFALILSFAQIQASVSAKHYPEMPVSNSPFYVAVTWQIPKGFHMEAPSEYMPQLTWQLPEGVTFSKWHWPVAQPFSSPALGGQALGYEKRVTAVAEFAVLAPFDVSAITAQVKWALCKDQCVLYSGQVDAKTPLSELQWLDVEELLHHQKTDATSFMPFVFAWVGGLILNVMPCVLPVLSLKVLDFLTPSVCAPWLRGLAFTGGVCTGFLALGAVMIGLQQTGTHVLGWGVHMQSAIFVSVMMLLFLFMGLHMWGVFEVGLALTRLQLPKWFKHPLLKAWGVGLVTCAVSTPCTAPFMGSALAYSLTASPLHTLGIMMCLALGLSTPVIVLTLFPQWMQWLPKPGMWMLRFKKLLSIGFFVTACWLAWVLSALTWGDVAKVDVPRIEQMLASDMPVMLDFTADWCVTCQANKQVLHDKDVQEALNKHGVTLITIDLTQHNADGAQLLSQFQRSAIPLLVYSRGHNQYTILPPLLTKEDVLGLFAGDNISH